MKYIKLFESFGRYDFGVHIDSSIIAKYMLDVIMVEEVSILDKELNAINETINNAVTDNNIIMGSLNRYSKVIHLDGSDINISMTNLGDYCYALCVYNSKRLSKNNYAIDYLELYIEDDFGDFLTRLSSLIKKYFLGNETY